MARANLNVSQQLQTEFQKAQEPSSKVRAIKAVINEEEISFSSSLTIVRTADHDFDALIPSILKETEAAMVLFRLGDDAKDKTKKWLLIAWIPDGCKVRDKMLYSSSREDLKRNLGLGLFGSDYAASSLTEILWEGYVASTQVQKNDVTIMTEREKTLKEEAVLVQIERTQLGAKSTAMGVVPFTLGPGVSDAYKQFIAGKYNWLELSVVSEVVNLNASKLVDVKDNLEVHVNTTAARFILARFMNYEKKHMNFFVYSCPENVPVRDKMTMSTSKATVIGTAGEHGISFDK